MCNVKALEFAVADLFVKLSQILTDEHGQPLLVLNHGFHFIVPDDLFHMTYKTGRIRPHDWEKRSYIKASFVRQGETWCLDGKGTIVAPHQPAFMRPLHFSPARGGIGLEFTAEHESDQSLADGGLVRFAEKLVRAVALRRL